MWGLYKEYESWLKLTSPASAEQDLGTEEHQLVRYERAAVESLCNQTLSQHIYITDKELVKVTPPGMQAPVDQTAERIIYQGWIAATDGEVLQ
jgi:hypothetical protein